MIHQYAYKPRPAWQRAETDPSTTARRLFMGFELEVECGDADCEGVSREVDVKQWLYCKYDGSLSNGIEIVSHPLSWAWISQHKAELAHLLKYLDKRGCTSYNTNTCGLHVHMSRGAIGKAALHRMQRFVYGNPDFIYKVSRRPERRALDNYARVHLDSYSLSEVMEGKGLPDRHVAINTKNRSTVECRIFKGTLKPSSFFRAFEFCHALVRFCKSKRDLDVDAFKGFVAENEDEYPYLHEFLEAEVKTKARAKAKAKAPAPPTVEVRETGNIDEDNVEALETTDGIRPEPTL